MDETFMAYIGLLTLATSAIYAGAWGSLPPRPSRQQKEVAEEDDDDERDLEERLSSSDAYLFPLFASVALVGLYLVFKYLGTEWVNWLLECYFAVMGVGSVWKTLAKLLRGLLGREKWRSFDKTRLYVVKDKRELFSLSLRTPTAFVFPFALLPSVLYILSNNESKPALLTNILGLSFAHNALCLLKLDSFQTGTILLAGLFIYDIWWVFGTEVMVKVATTLDAPVKILWPKSGDFSGTKGFMMLGLGDIVIPGAFVTLGLRRDLSVSPAQDPDVPFAKPYFIASLVAYILGLMTTMGAMHVFQAAQPALLYLSPACILSFLITGLVRRELKEAWSWKDELEPRPQPAELTVRDPVPQPNGDALAPTSGSAVEKSITDEAEAKDKEGEKETRSKNERLRKK